MVECAGGSDLCAGHLMPPQKTVAACIEYRVNVLAGGASQILEFANHVTSLPSSTRSSIKISKFIYNSEMIPRSRREYMISVFGHVAFYSILASAETDAWAIAKFAAIGEPMDDNAADFLFDARAMKVEVLSMSSAAVDDGVAFKSKALEFVPEGTAGHLVLTCLQCQRNPLIRCVSGDIGSLQPLPASTASSMLDLDVLTHLKVLRLFGRDQRFSFKWLGEDFEFGELSRAMQTDKWGVLQWQIILANDDERQGLDACELRLLRHVEGRARTADTDLVRQLRSVFHLIASNERLLKLVHVDDAQEFECSGTSNKVVKFIDRRT